MSPPIPLIAAFLAAGLLAGCGRTQEGAAANAVAGNVADVAATPGRAAPAQPVEIKSDKDGLEFAYAWPSPAAAIPELDAWLRGNAEAQRVKAAKEAVDDQAQARKAGYPFHDHNYVEKYAVAADTPRVLVLQSDGYVFTGGAHGMPFNTVIIWDKTAKKRLPTSALVDIAAFKRLADDRFCKELDRQRAEKRGAPVKPGDPDQIDSFTTCVDLAKQTLLPISQKGRALDALRIVVGPYEAGPYAEGRYTIELPFDAKTAAAVQPAWKDAFEAR